MPIHKSSDYKLSAVKYYLYTSYPITPFEEIANIPVYFLNTS